jgi:hypothetical protein
MNKTEESAGQNRRIWRQLGAFGLIWKQTTTQYKKVKDNAKSKEEREAPRSEAHERSPWRRCQEQEPQHGGF